jgi:predicted restriction endonuclease
LEISPGEFYVEAHHLKPLGRPHDGPDVAQNMICVCPNCHVLLDFSVQKLSIKHLKASRHDIGSEFISYHNDLCR